MTSGIRIILIMIILFFSWFHSFYKEESVSGRDGNCPLSGCCLSEGNTGIHQLAGYSSDASTDGTSDDTKAGRFDCPFALSRLRTVNALRAVSVVRIEAQRDNLSVHFNAVDLHFETAANLDIVHQMS